MLCYCHMAALPEHCLDKQRCRASKVGDRVSTSLEKLVWPDKCLGGATRTRNQSKQARVRAYLRHVGGEQGRRQGGSAAQVASTQGGGAGGVVWGVRRTPRACVCARRHARTASRAARNGGALRGRGAWPQRQPREQVGCGGGEGAHTGGAASARLRSREAVQARAPAHGRTRAARGLPASPPCAPPRPPPTAPHGRSHPTRRALGASGRARAACFPLRGSSQCSRHSAFPSVPARCFFWCLASRLAGRCRAQCECCGGQTATPWRSHALIGQTQRNPKARASLPGRRTPERALIWSREAPRAPFAAEALALRAPSRLGRHITCELTPRIACTLVLLFTAGPPAAGRGRQRHGQGLGEGARYVLC